MTRPAKCAPNPSRARASWAQQNSHSFRRLTVRAILLRASESSVCPDRESSDPGFRVRPVIRAQGVRIETASDAAVVTKQLEDECQRNRGQQLVDAIPEPDHVICVRCERVIAVEDDGDRP